MASKEIETSREKDCYPETYHYAKLDLEGIRGG